jgi:hypothetical protein
MNSRRVVALVRLAACVAAGVVGARSHRTLAVERARKCNSNVQRDLCGLDDVRSAAGALKPRKRGSRSL